MDTMQIKKLSTFTKSLYPDMTPAKVIQRVDPDDILCQDCADIYEDIDMDEDIEVNESWGRTDLERWENSGVFMDEAQQTRHKLNY
jgi:hypothetical protein